MTVKQDVDQRDFPRMRVAAELRYRVADGSEGWQQGRVENLSATGVLFVTTAAIDNGAELELEVLAARGAAPLRAKGQVLRIEQRGAEYAVAVEMSDVN